MYNEGHTDAWWTSLIDWGTLGACHRVFLAYVRRSVRWHRRWARQLCFQYGADLGKRYDCSTVDYGRVWKITVATKMGVTEDAPANYRTRSGSGSNGGMRSRLWKRFVIGCGSAWNGRGKSSWNRKWVKAVSRREHVWWRTTGAAFCSSSDGARSGRQRQNFATVVCKYKTLWTLLCRCEGNI